MLPLAEAIFNVSVAALGFKDEAEAARRAQEDVRRARAVRG